MPEVDTTENVPDVAELLVIVNRVFAQTTWLCQMVQAMIETMPPQMRPVIREN